LLQGDGRAGHGARNADAIERGGVDLRRGSVATLPFDDGAFEAALAINSLQVWPDARAGRREIGRVLRPGGRMALGFTPYAGQPRTGITDLVSAVGFAEARLVETEHGFFVLARKP
jgi:ubiquinone/menaquinone biosynthesis C-methylase UbiE